MKLTPRQISTREDWMRAHDAHRTAAHGFRHVTRKRLYDAATAVLTADIQADKERKALKAGRHYLPADTGRGVSSQDVCSAKPARKYTSQKQAKRGDEATSNPQISADRQEART